jgi:hypothetical protein
MEGNVMYATKKRHLAFCDQAGREFRVSFSESTFQDACDVAFIRYGDQCGQLAFRAGWLRADSELIHDDFLKGMASFQDRRS